MAPSKKPYPKSPFLAPRRSSSYGGVNANDTPPPHTKNNAISSDKINAEVEPEHKSTLIGCTANLITAIVGAGIIGIPYAMRETGLIAGWFLMILSAVLGCKSLRLLVETAKHVDASSYEVLAETVFGQTGWVSCNAMMFMMSWGPMLSYLIIVKDTLGKVVGYPGPNCLIISSLFVILPISLQRDMADLAKTSRLSVFFNIALVVIIATFSPTSDSIEDAGGLSEILSQSTLRPSTCFIGLGVISFAFSCQHSSLIIAGSLANPTRERWGKVSAAALTFCVVVSLIMGSFGYVGFLEETDGNILNNFLMPDEAENPADLLAAKAANVARAFVCGTMLFVYPLESFVARHVVMTNLFRGREAHEGDDHAVLDRWDRRAATTIALYLSVLIPALHYDDVGIVLSFTGTVSATSLSYIGPGLLFIGVHGEEFLDLVDNTWGESPGLLGKFMWYFLLVPVWCHFASLGRSASTTYLAKKEMMTPADIYRLGKVKHRRDMIAMQKQARSRENFHSEDDHGQETGAVANKTVDALGLITATAESTKSYGSIASNLTKNSQPQSEEADAEVGEDDPQDEKQTTSDFAVAIGFVVFGIIAFIAGVYSICTSGSAGI